MNPRIFRRFFASIAALLLALALHDAHAAQDAPSAKEKEEKKSDTETTTLDLGGGVKMTLVKIEAGEFLMGSPADEKERDDDEEQHEQKIDKPFYMGIHAVTRGQFARFVLDKSYKTDAEKDGKGGWGVVDGEWKQDPKFTWRDPGFQQDDDHPVVNVSWHDAVAFCGWLSEKTKRTVRLPTEAEWEYACRAGTTTTFSFGNTINTDEANYNGNVTYGNGVKGMYREKTIPVGSLKKPNPWGLYDMHGNVWEWCSSKYADYPYQADDEREEAGGTASRVLRGGSWSNSPIGLRAALRNWGSPGYRGGGIGFRVCAPLGSPGLP